MSDRLEEALVEVISRIEAGEALDADRIREGYPDCWEAIGDVLDLRAKLADVGGLESTPATAHVACGTKLRVVDDGRYEGFRLLGEGGMGMVYWALDTELNREVAFKVVRPQTHPARPDAPSAPIHVAAPFAGTRASQAFETLKARFLQEAWVTAGLEHPGIVPVYEVGQTPQRVPYYTMRFVRGSRTLTQAMDDVRTRPFEERLALLEPFLRVCDTMRYAHAHGVVHRDLKPDNVALGEFGEVVVLDWGIAKIRDRPDAAAATWKLRLDEFRSTADLRTRVGAMGTPGYMSPEAATGRIDEVDQRSDVYSLGAILFQILTGRLPYEFRTYGEMLRAMEEAPPPAPDSIDAAVPPVLSAICLHALERDRCARPQTVDALATDVRARLAKRARDHEIDVLEREATVSTAALADLQGDALLKQLDRVHAAATKLLDRAPESETARGLLREAERRRELGIQQRERAARRRILRRTVVVGLAVALVGTGGAALVVRTERDAKALALIEARALALANASKAAEAVDPMRALLLAREAARVQMSPATVSQLHSALVGSLEDVVFRGHTAAVISAAYSTTGDVVTASADHTAWIWKTDGTPIAHLVGHERSVWCAAFSPEGDRVLTGSEDGTARLWNLDGKQIAVLVGHTDTVNIVAYSPEQDGRRFVTGSLDGTARLWDADGNLLEVLAGHGGPLTAVAWSPKGERIATASEDGDVRVWGRTGAAVKILAHRSRVAAVAFSPDAAVLLTGADDGVARVWDVDAATPKEAQHPDWEGARLTSVAFSPDGRHFAVGDSDGNAWIWNRDGTFAAELRGHSKAVSSMTFSADGEMLATSGGADRTARVWDMNGGTVAVFRGHGGPVGVVQFRPKLTPDRGRVLTASDDGTARTWRLRGAEIETYRSVKWGMHAMAACECGIRRFLAVPSKGAAVLLDKYGKRANEYGSTIDRIRSVRFSRDVGRVATADRFGFVRLYKLRGRTPELSFQAHREPCSADFSPDGAQILTWSDDRTARLWNLAGNPLQTFDEHEGPVTSAAFSPKDRNLVVTGSSDCRARIWDARTGKLMHTLTGHRDAVASAVFSHDGRRVLTAGGADQTARIWDLDGRELLKLPHASAASVAAFSPDDSVVAIGCDDGSVWLWDAVTRDLLSRLTGHSAKVIAVEFAADGRSIATACHDGNVRIRYTLPEDVLKAVERKITRQFTHSEISHNKALLGSDHDTLLAAYDEVERRLASTVVVEEVVAEVRDDATLATDVRDAALDVLRRRFDDPERVRVKAWEVVRQRGLRSEDYERARRWATIADDLGRGNIDARVLLGVAQHRVGDEAGALRTIEAVDSKIRESSTWTHLSCVAALALVHHALRDDDKAREDFARFDRLFDNRPESAPFAYRVFFEEANALRRELGDGK